MSLVRPHVLLFLPVFPLTVGTIRASVFQMESPRMDGHMHPFPLERRFLLDRQHGLLVEFWQSEVSVPRLFACCARTVQNRPLLASLGDVDPIHSAHQVSGLETAATNELLQLMVLGYLLL